MATKILLVDDEPEVEGMVKLKYRKEIREGKYEFVFASDGRDALNKLQSFIDIDIVISDINMPVMDGLTLLNHLNNLDRILKAIVVSAYGDMDNIRTAMNRGAYDFLTKPINFEDLTVTIEKTKKTIADIKNNIEALKTAEMNLRESMALNTAIISNAVDSIITIDDKGRIISINPATENMFGYKANELAGQNVSLLMPSAFLGLDNSFIHDNIETGKAANIGIGRESFARRKNGTEFEIELAVSKVGLGEKMMFNGIIRDISLRKKAELLLKEYNSELEQEVSRRTQELVNLNKEKNEILGVAAHDLKNPLSNIKMLAKILKEDELNKEEISEFSNDIFTTSERMFDMIKQLLDSNAVEEGKINIEFEYFDICEVLNKQINSFSEYAQSKNINIIFSPDNLNIKAYADRSASMQVMDNLISNAIKYSPANKNVYISLFSTIDEIIFEVKDEGPGISEIEAQKLFTKFAKLTPRPTAGEHSTGLGLSIVKKLVELMKGRVWCESEEGSGSKFYAAFRRYSENCPTGERLN